MWIVTSVLLPLFVYCGWAGLRAALVEPERDPMASLLSFSQYQLEKRGEHQITDIGVENMNYFSGAACVRAENAGSARLALARQLRSLPAAVAEELVEAAIVEGVSVRNSYQNVSLGLAGSNKGYAYLVFYDTVYSPETGYASCVMASTVELQTADTIAGTIEKKENVVIGYQPCRCGLLYCEKCPLIQETLTRTPIFKKAILTLKQADELQQYLIDQAVNRALPLIHEKKQLLGEQKTDMPDNWKDNVISTDSDSVQA